MKIIDWAEIYNRLEYVNKAIECGFKRTAEECAGIIKKRTEIFAREAKIHSGEGEYLEVVEFSLAHERYAIQTDYVREIIVLHELISIPCTPPYVSGIINIRGDIISVIDLKRFFDLPEKGLSDLNKVIILYYEDMIFGIL
ncbi:MAG: chemotaxis protein CheW, partial [Nitrospira sp.]|nr:chemotaxis protein CheW [Nitrospira sp.]